MDITYCRTIFAPGSQRHSRSFANHDLISEAGQRGDFRRFPGSFRVSISWMCQTHCSCLTRRSSLEASDKLDGVEDQPCHVRWQYLMSADTAFDEFPEPLAEARCTPAGNSFREETLSVPDIFIKMLPQSSCFKFDRMYTYVAE